MDDDDGDTVNDDGCDGEEQPSLQRHDNIHVVMTRLNGKEDHCCYNHLLHYCCCMDDDCTTMVVVVRAVPSFGFDWKVVEEVACYA